MRGFFLVPGSLPCSGGVVCVSTTPRALPVGEIPCRAPIPGGLDENVNPGRADSYWLLESEEPIIQAVKLAQRRSQQAIFELPFASE